RQYVVELRELERSPDQVQARLSHEAILKILARTYRQTQAQNRARFIEGYPAYVRQAFESAVQQHPEVSLADVVQARQTLERAGIGWLPLSASQIMSDRLENVSVVGICSILLAAILGTPLLFRINGMRLQTATGRRAGRWRCVLRSTIAW